MKTPRRILIVEDERLVAEDLAESLATEHFEVSAIVSSAERALEYLSRERPDLIMMDIRLEGTMDGIEAAECVRKQFNLPVVFLTAHADEATLQRAMISEPFGYLLKPFSRKELRTTIQMAIQKHEMEGRIRASEERHRFLLETMNDGFFMVDQDHTIVFANARFAEMSGFDRSHLIDRRLHDLFPPESITEYLEQFASATPDNAYCFESALRTACGGLVPTMVSVRFTYDAQDQCTGSFAVITDVTALKKKEEELRLARNQLEVRVAERTAELLNKNEQLRQEIQERKTAEKALRESEERFRLLAEQNVLAVAIIQDGRLTYTNRAVEELTGYAALELMQWDGGDLAKLVHAEDLPLVEQVIQPRTQQPVRSTTQTSVRIVTRSGERRWTDLYTRVIRYQSKPAILVTFVDRTDQKRAQELTVERERLTAIADLASGVAHNFNNLLQIVIGGTQMALMDIESGEIETATDGLEQILESTLFGAETVRNLQTFANVRAEAEDAESSVFDLACVVDQVVEMTKPWWKTAPVRRGTPVAVHLELDEGCLVHGRRNQFFEMMVNLVKNAAEALPSGGDIWISTRVRNGQVIVAVEDNGIGIPRDHLGKVFEPFWGNKGLHGTGMGLAISYGIVKAHGGTIHLESQIDEGTSFTVYIPLAHDPAEHPENHENHFTAPALTILVVDDIPAVLSTMRRTLERLGQHVVTADSGIEALAAFRNHQVDLVICDLGMPGMDGWEVGRSIKEHCLEKGVRRPPFVMLTGWGGQVMEQDRMGHNGVDMVIEKPLDLAKLRLTLEQFRPASSPSAR